MSREVMKLALETLEKYHTGISILNDGPDDSDVAHAQGLIFKSMDLTLLAIPALRKAIKEAEKQEPVAWKHDCDAILMNNIELWINACPHCGKPRHSSLCL